jgi:hypothetical protein
MSAANKQQRGTTNLVVYALHRINVHSKYTGLELLDKRQLNTVCSGPMQLKACHSSGRPRGSPAGKDIKLWGHPREQWRTFRPLRTRNFVTSSSSLLPLSRGAIRNISTSCPTYTHALTSLHDLPVVEHALRERLSTSGLSQVSVEPEGLVDGHYAELEDHLVKQGNHSRYALTVNMGVPTLCSSLKTCPRRLFRQL